MHGGLGSLLYMPHVLWLIMPEFGNYNCLRVYIIMIILCRVLYERQFIKALLVYKYNRFERQFLHVSLLLLVYIVILQVYETSRVCFFYFDY